MKILVAVSNYYPTEKIFSTYYERNRNIYYKEQGAEVSVLNFSAKENYIVDNIQTYSLHSIEKKLEQDSFDILVCHAANIRNHYILLKKHEKKFKSIVFIFHGQEVVKISQVYPKPYEWNKHMVVLKTIFRNCYDILKINLWRKFHKKLARKSHYVFVSDSLYREFMFFLKIKPSLLNNRYSIIHNGVGHLFEKRYYDYKVEKQFDFITIRSNIDSSVYCLDIIVFLARKYPNNRFLVIGVGKFFDYEKKPENLIHINKHLNHNELMEWIDISKCALMPTRRDTQGVMSCELATYGIPLISSDISVCREILSSFENVKLVSDYTKVDLICILNNLFSKLPYDKQSRYFAENTSGVEFELFNKLIRKNLSGEYENNIE